MVITGTRGGDRAAREGVTRSTVSCSVFHVYATNSAVNSTTVPTITVRVLFELDLLAGLTVFFVLTFLVLMIVYAED
jgi:hypothetical protein